MTAGPVQAPGASLEFRSVTKRYGRSDGARGAVNDLSFEVPAGKICVLVGPSGCGKTTSLRMVNRLIEPTSGTILLDGCDVAGEDVTALRRRIGYVIQQVGLFPHLTIEKNVAVVPARFVMLAGELVISGASMTVNTATALVAVPNELLNTTE